MCTQDKSKILKSVFPVNNLRKDGTLIDPANTNGVWDYYLLENLASGLVTDDMSRPGGYYPVLAESWDIVSEHEWRFCLRDGATEAIFKLIRL